MCIFRRMLYITLELIAINTYGHMMYAHKKNPSRFKVLSFFSSAECLSLYYFSLSRHPTASLVRSFSLCLFHISAQINICVCVLFVSLHRESVKRRRERKKMNQLFADCCVLHSHLFERRKEREKERIYRDCQY